MNTDQQRVDWIRQALHEAELDAVVSTFAAHILMLTGYWPVIGTSIAIATSDGTVALLVPEDEQQLASQSWAEPIVPYQTGGLRSLETPLQAVVHPLQRLSSSLQLGRARIGYERGPVSEPSTYASVYIFGASVVDLLRHTNPDASLRPADELLERLCSIKTPTEISRIRAACGVAARAFERGLQSVAIGSSEAGIANAFRAGLNTGPLAAASSRSDGFAYCMSGPNAARAYGAFAQTGHREIAEGDLVLVHCNSYVDGYWTDITRTYTVGSERDSQREWRSAIEEARASALRVIKPGVPGSDVDHAAREVFRRRGLDKLFRHSTGHGVGFAAISANARPRLHPHSQDVLQQGMVFNVEPALYLDGVGGMRHCDMVAVSDKGFELLTPFQLDTNKNQSLDAA